MGWHHIPDGEASILCILESPYPRTTGHPTLSHNLASRCHQAELGLSWGLTALGHVSSPPWKRILEAGLMAFHFVEPGSHLHIGEVSPTV